MADGIETFQDALAAHPLVIPGRTSGIRTGWDALIDRTDAVPRLAAEADDMAMLVQEMGVAVDRDSFAEKCRKLAVEPKEIFSMAKQIYKDATDVQKAIEAIAKAAA